MGEKRFELRLCSNGTYYVYENGELVIDNISFDRFNKDDANALIGLLNELYGEMKRFGEHNYKLEQYNLHYLNENTRLKEDNEQLQKELELTANTKLYSRRELEMKVDEQQSVIDEQNQRIRKLESILKKFQFPVERV